MKNAVLFFFFGLLIITVGCRKEHVLTKGQDSKKASTSNNSNNSDKNLDGVWVALEWEKVLSAWQFQPVIYAPKETYIGDPNGPSAKEFKVTGEEYNKINAPLNVISPNLNHLGDWRIDSLENDADNLDTNYRYWVWITRMYPAAGEIGRMKLGKREND